MKDVLTAFIEFLGQWISDISSEKRGFGSVIVAFVVLGLALAAVYYLTRDF